MAQGPRDTSSLVMLTGWDATELQNFKLQDGTSYADIVAEINTAIATLNAEFTNDPMWAGLCYFTDEPENEYRVGSNNAASRHTEYGTPDAYRAATEGHMIPLQDWDRGLGWTWDYLRKARMKQIRADLRAAVQAMRDRWRVQILTRLLQRGDDSGSNNGLGSSGYSPGFATTAASTSVDFTPPDFNGTSFSSTHEHYIGIAGGAFTAAVFSDAYDELREHGHNPPFDFLVGTSDRSTVEGLTGFTEVGDPMLRYGSNQDIANVGDQYIGVISHFRVREVRGIPQYYGVGYKSYGPRSQSNPLAIRLAKGEAVPRVTAMTDPRAGSGAYPLQFLMLFTEFGVGVNDRTAGTPRYVNNATWADGTPT